MSFFVEGVAACLAGVLRHSPAPFEEKTSPCSVFSVVAVEAAVLRKGSRRQTLFSAQWSRRCRSTKYPSRLFWAHHPCRISCGMCRVPSLYTFIGGVGIGDGMDGSGDWGPYASSTRTTAIVASTLKRLGGQLRSLILGGTNGC